MIGAMNTRTLVLIPVLIAALALSACGSSSSSSTSTTSGSTASTSTSTTSSGGTVGKAEQACLDAAKSISDEKSRSIAEQGCKTLANNPKVTDALVQAKKKCLEAAAQIPVAGLQQTAVEACNKVSP